MTIRMLVDALHEEETRVVIADDNNLLEFDIETTGKKQTKGNIYLAKVTRVEPSLQAAFVEYGAQRQGFLPFAEIHPDYYQIPVADKQALLREQEAEMKEEEERFEKAEAAASKSSEEKISESEPVEGEEGEQKDGVVEEIGTDAPFEQAPRRQRSRRYKIQEVVKKNQLVLIQVIKEERGNKGASVTSYISIPGRYCVLMPNSSRGGGVSRKISDSSERKKLKEIMNEIKVKDGMSIILRTAGMNRNKTEITRDYNYLSKLWNTVRESALNSVAPALVYEEANVVKRALRDLYNNDFEEVLVAGDKAFKLARDFMKLIMPSHVKKVIEYTEKTPLFNKYGVERHLASMYDPVVTMQSGGYIVLNATEALISIDVNSGRATGERNVEDTATRTNIEAAYEVARQLRLRDLAGLVVIDFIDMLDGRHRKQVERALKDALRHDRAKIQVGRISPFGLLEMSRQRLRPSLVEINMHECPTCKGAGNIRSNDSIMVQLMRAVENELAASEDKPKKVTLTTNAELALYFLNHKRKNISALEEQYGFELAVSTENIHPGAYKIALEFEGGRTKNVSSEDREGGRLPQSRESASDRNRRRRDDRRNSKDRRPGGKFEPRGDRFNNNNSQPQSPNSAEAESADFIETPSNITEVADHNDGDSNRRDFDGQGRNRRRRRGGRNRNRNRNRDFRGGEQKDFFSDQNGQNQKPQGSEVENIYSDTPRQEPEAPKAVAESRAEKAPERKPKGSRAKAERAENQNSPQSNRSSEETSDSAEGQEVSGNRKSGWWRRKIVE